jgi:hypothetical protein
MSTEQWIGGLLAVIGGYFVICSIRFRSFFLYRLKIARLKALVGESNAHRFYFLLGALAVLFGILKAAAMDDDLLHFAFKLADLVD